MIYLAALGIITRKNLCFLVVEAAMAIAFKIGIGNLIAELLAHTVVFFGFQQTAGAIAFLFYKPHADFFDNVFIFVKSDFQGDAPPFSSLSV